MFSQSPERVSELQEGIGPFQDSITSDTSLRFAGRTVDGLEEQERNTGTDRKPPAGDVGGHLGCTSEVCMFAFHPSKLFKFLSSIVVSDYFVVDM